MTKNYLFKIIVICAVFCQFFTKAQAQYAIGGTAGTTLTKSVYWLTWDPTATGSTLISAPSNSDAQHIVNGTYVWQYSPTVRITAIIANEVFVNGITMQAYTPGNFTGDGLDLLYSGNNLPKPDSRGIPGSGLATTGNSTVTFDIDVKVAILINGVYTDVVYPGMVIGDAESIDSQGEYISGDTPNPVAWQLLNKRTQGNAADTHYLMDLSNNGRSFKLRADLAPGNFGVQAVMFAHGARNLTNLSMLGSGITAMSIGFVLPFDQGDAPSSYGTTGHYIDDFVITDFFAGDGTYAVVNYNTTPLVPQATVYIGANNVDADGTYAFDALASGDDNTGNADESTLTPATLPDLKVNQPGNYVLTVPVTNTKNIPATLYAWVDFNGDGVFGSNEVVTVTVPANTANQNVTLTFPNSQFASIIKSGILYARLRITTTNLIDNVATTIDERSTSYAADGEAEDYRLKSILGISISGTVRDDPNGNLDNVISGTGLSTVSGSQLFAYLISGTAIVNKATVAADGSYTFAGNNNGTYIVAISTNNVAIGGTLASVAANLPSAWLASGETFGLNNAAGTGIETGTPNLQITVTTPTTSQDVSGVDFGIDQVPVAVTDNVTAVAGQALVINVLANDTDADGTIDVTSVRVIDPADNIAKTSVTIANQGTYTVNTATGAVTFTPLVTFSGNSTPVSYTIKDNFGAPSSSTVNAQISVAVRPTGVNDSDITLINTPVTTTVKANDGASNTNATVIAGNGTNGTTTVNAAGQVTYTPATGFTGVDTYTYTITNGALVSNPITVTITVSATPIGVADVGSTLIATPVTTTVLANDGSFATGSTVTAGANPAHGTIVRNNDNTITYTPNATFTGIETYTYTLTKNGSTSAPINVSISVVPVGTNDNVTTPLNTAVTTTVKANDGNSGTGTTVTAGNGAHGTTSVNTSDQVTFTPTANFIGIDTYTYTLTTADGVASTPIMVNVTIRPIGVADASSTLINTPVATTVTTNDGISATGATVTAGNGAHGTTTTNSGVVTFTPTAGYVGIDTYTYTLTNNGAVSNPITVTITVNPVAVADVATTPLNTPVATTVLSNDGLSGVGATVTPVNGANGTTAVNGAGVVTFTPTTGFIGVTTYTYTLTNGGATSAPVTVTVTVRPVGVADASSTPLNTAVATTVTANDGASATGATVTAGNGAHGTTTTAGGVVTFTPTTGYIGVDTYTYTLTNNTAVSDPITVTITVIPVGVADAATTPINTAVATTVTANDGISGTGATVTPTAGAHGTTTAAGGVVTFTPTNNYIGLDTYTYTLTNNGATSAPITVTVSVRPVGVADAAVTPTATPVSIIVKGNDGVSGTGTTVNATNGTNGTTVVSATGVVTYTPTAAFNGTDTFTYTLTTTDGVISDPVTVTITVSPRPVGVADAATTPINTAITTTVTANDGADGVGAVVASGALPTHGAIVVNADNTITYTPTTNYIGLDTYTYTITKGGLTSNPINVTISVRPVGVNDAATTPINTLVATTVKTNDGVSGTGTTVTPTAGAHGTTTVNGAGVVSYTPTTGYIGLDTYTYTLTTADGVVSAPITVNVTVRPVGIADVATTSVNTPVATTVKANDGASGTGTIVASTTPAHGTTTVDAAGVITYTPLTGYLGPDAYTYTLTTTDGAVSDPVTVTINVRPVGVADVAITNINTPIATTVKANDGASGTGATVTPTAGAHGTTTVDAAGVVTYTPATNYIGLDTYTYTLNNNTSVSDPITVSVTVRPVAIADATTTNINTPVATTVKSNDGSSGTGTTVTPGTPTHGTTTVDAVGVITYTPTPGYIGLDSYTYTLTTPDGAVSIPVTVSLGVRPTGVADAATTPVSTPVVIIVKTNDGASGTGTTVATTVPAHGTTTVNGTGQVTYTPTTGYIGIDTFTYTLTTTDGVVSAPINVSVNVSPLGVADVAATNVNTAVAITVKANDGASGTGTTVTPSTPAHGTTTVDAAGVVTYTPTTGYIGTDAFTYTLTTNDGVVSAPVNVTVSVRPVGIADASTTNINTAVVTTVKSNDGASGTGTTVTTTIPAHGTTTVDAAGAVTYTPATNYIGLDSYTYILTTTDGVVSAPITVSLTVKPLGVADAATTTLNTPVAVTVKANDGPSGTGTTVIPTVPAHGTTTVSPTGVITYTPTTGYFGPDAFTYTLNTPDGVASDPISVSLTISSAIPVGSSDIVITPINTAATTTVTANDADGATSTVAAGTTAPAHGTILVNANGTITYTPTTNYIGQDAYTYTLTKNSQTSAQIAVTVGVLPVGIADAATTSVNTPVSIIVKGNDGPSGINTTVTPTVPAHGTTSVNNSGVVTYTPTTGYIGADSFTYTLTTTDGVVSNDITVSLTVSALPVGVADAFTTSIGVALPNTNVTANDGTAGVGATVAAGTLPAHGSIVVNADGTISYTPVATYTGLDTYTYTLTKAGITSAPIIVTITIKPVGVADAATTNLNTAITTPVKSNDGPSGTNTTVTVTQPAHGTTIVTPAGAVTYTPTTGYLGSDSYTYTLTTPDGVASDAITVAITVTTLPVGVADDVITNINVPVTTAVTANDGADGIGSVVAAGSTAPAHGSIVINADRTITYIPVSTYVGKDTYTYTLTKNGQTSLPVTVTISIKPTGTTDVTFTGINTPVTITVKANDNPGTPTPTVTTTVPAHGTTTVTPTGQVIYTPTTGYSGPDTFTYVLTTPDGVASDPITVNVTISSSAGVPDVDVTLYNTAVTTTVKANDGAASANSTVTATNGSHGTTVVNTNGTVTYTPVNYVGLDTYTYTLNNGTLVSNPITVTISVKPVGRPDGALTQINTPITTAVKNNDGPSSVGTTVVPTNGSNGTTTVDANGNVTYTPVTNYTGTDTYTYRLVTGDGVSSDPITVTVSVRLLGVADAVTTTVNTPITTNVKANDGVSGNGADVTPTNGSHGTTVVDATGLVTYTPVNDFIGTDTYTYILSIPGAVSDPITVTVTIKPAPGVPDASTTAVNVPVTTNVKANDGTTNAGATVTAGNGAHGTTTVNATTGVVTYTPAPNYAGVDTYTYTLTTNGLVSDPVTVTITIKPSGGSDIIVTTLNTPVTANVKVNDAGAAAATVSVNPPAHGTTTVDPATNLVTYTPTPGYIGPDSFTYTITNAGATSDPIQVTVTVRPLGVADADLTPVNTAVTTTVKANDGTASATGTVIASNGTHGTVTVNGSNQVIYTPATGYVGFDTYTYTLTVNGIVSDPITVTINVYRTGLTLTKVATNTGTKVGDVLNYTIVVTNTGTIGLTNIVVSDPGADAGSVTPASIASLAIGGTATVTAKHTLTQADIDKGSYTNVASVVATDPKDPGKTTPPVKSDDPTTSTPGDGTTTVINPITSIKLVKTGVSAINTITYTFVFTNTGNTTINTLTLTDTKLGMTNVPMALPATGLVPGASFTYTAIYTLTDADKLAGSVVNSASAATIDTKGNPVVSTGPTGTTTTTLPTSPVAANDGATTSGNQPVMIPVLNNDNPGSATFIPTSVEIVTPPAHGTVVINPDGTMTYTPSNGYSGPDTYTYRVKDTNGYFTNVATVTITNTSVGLTPPTFFTPNGDGINDVFEIRGLGQFAQNDIVIVNRWGNEVYKTKDYQNNWAGEGLNEGTYYYILRVKATAADNFQTIKGWVTLLRTFKK